MQPTEPWSVKYLKIFRRKLVWSDMLWKISDTMYTSFLNFFSIILGLLFNNKDAFLANFAYVI